MPEAIRSYTRRLKRHALDGHVEVFDSVRGVYLGRLVNIHAEGLMLIGDIALEDDKLYQLDLRLPQAINGRESIPLGVDCLWARASDDFSKHWSGCQIIDISPQGAEDIDALIQLMGQ